MFTGIVRGVAEVVDVGDHGGIRSLKIRCPHGFCDEVQIGASISVDGVCLTVVDAPGRDIVVFDVIRGSLEVTTLGTLVSGSCVNVERSACQGDEIGGHVVSGHVDFQAEILEMSRDEHNCKMCFHLPTSWSYYLFSKGYVAVNGVSLTVADVDKDQGFFQVWLIPETCRRTTFGEKRVGDHVNVEVERTTQILVDTIRRTLRESLGSLDLVDKTVAKNKVPS